MIRSNKIIILFFIFLVSCSKQDGPSATFYTHNGLIIADEAYKYKYLLFYGVHNQQKVDTAIDLTSNIILLSKIKLRDSLNLFEELFSFNMVQMQLVEENGLILSLNLRPDTLHANTLKFTMMME